MPIDSSETDSNNVTIRTDIKEQIMAARLAGKVALIFGAGSAGPGWGNGKAISVLFAREGAQVAAVDLHVAHAEETHRLIVAEGGDCEALQADVTDSRQVGAAVKRCMDRYGRVDVLVNNVGTAVLGGPVEQSEEDWRRVCDTNLTSMFLTCKHVLPIMTQQARGAIVNISSLASIRWAGQSYVSYAASKAGVNQLTQVVAMQYARQGIRSNAVLPGMMNTPMIVEALKKYGLDVAASLAERDRACPTGKMGDAWDVAYAALYLASDEAKYVTGALLTVDGGLSVVSAASH
jgi:NAD(P)-dependent dehydrogenase (short-subunit alcohol dehydrogenase family)